MSKRRKPTRPANQATAPPADQVTGEKTGIASPLQQRCLNVFRDALWTSEDDLKAVQEVKGHLYRRDFIQAFSKPEYLRAYALRWSAARALCYAHIFGQLPWSQLPHGPGGLSCICIGGGAGAELVGLATFLNHRESHCASTSEQDCTVAHLVDIADWSEVVTILHAGVVTAPKLSRYASEAVKERNTALIAEGKLAVQKIMPEDVLHAISTPRLRNEIRSANLITMMFTLNELYPTSLNKTTAFLRGLTNDTTKGALLLVVDSPGSYSTVKVGTEDKRYPMHWLLDHALLGKPGTEEYGASWQKLSSIESEWFRLPQGLEYPVELEDMRYQQHVYQRK